MAGVADFEAAGLYDPADPDAADRLALLEWLAAQGFDVAQMRAAADAKALVAMVGDRLLLGELTLSLRNLAGLTGMSLEQVEQVMRAAGFPGVDPDERRYDERDVSTFRLFAAASELFSPAEILHFTRVLGSSLARVAEAANSLFLADVERPLQAEGRGELALAKANAEAVSLALQVSKVMDTLLRYHIVQVTQRFRGAFTHANTLVEVAVGFVDLCGFTAASQEITADELARMIRQFESQAYDLVAEHGGRVVKLIGDEVMFTAVDPADACTIADALLRAFGTGDLVPRGGIAAGPVLARGGDYYGPTVNLASRITDQAVPGEILTTRDVAAAAPQRVFHPAGRRLLKGFSEPVELVSFS